MVEQNTYTSLQRALGNAHAPSPPQKIKRSLPHGVPVLVHGAPVSVPFGRSLVLRREATVTRANLLERVIVRIQSMFELTELYEVSFSDGKA